MQTAVNVKPQINRHRLTATLYLNYLIHGFGIVILAQNMVALSHSWTVPVKIVSFVISGIGIGRLIAYLITGALADVISRKFFVVMGMLCYLIFAVGMITTQSIPIAYGLAILAGVANSALDAGTYTTLVEINGGKGFDTILIKGFMSIGEFILPILVATLATWGLWFGWSFIVMAVLIIANLINIVGVKFPHIQKVKLSVHPRAAHHQHLSLHKLCQTLLLLIYGYTSMALMIWFTQWITLFAQRTFNFSNISAHALLSLYSIGSMVGVITLFILLKRNVSEIKLMVTLNLVAVLSLIVIFMNGAHILVAGTASFIFGFSAASGVMQTGLTVFMNIFPHHRGMVTGAFYFFGSIASFTVPIITGVLVGRSTAVAFGGDIVVGIIGLLLVTLLALLKKNEGINAND